jgi:hypothetical protein
MRHGENEVRLQALHKLIKRRKVKKQNAAPKFLLSGSKPKRN